MLCCLVEAHEEHPPNRYIVSKGGSCGFPKRSWGPLLRGNHEKALLDWTMAAICSQVRQLPHKGLSYYGLSPLLYLQVSLVVRETPFHLPLSLDHSHSGHFSCLFSCCRPVLTPSFQDSTLSLGCSLPPMGTDPACSHPCWKPLIPSQPHSPSSHQCCHFLWTSIGCSLA